MDLVQVKAPFFKYVCRSDPEAYYRWKSRGFGVLGALGLYERDSMRTLVALTRAGDTAFDIGAHFGVFTTALSKKVGATGHVVAVEPLPFCVEHLSRHARRRRNVTVVEAAVSTEPDDVSFSIPIVDGAFPEPALASLAGTGRWPGTIDVRVPSTTVARLVGQYGVPDVIKADVEGAEALVLGGLVDLPGPMPRVIMFECVDPARVEPEVRELQARHGYRIATPHGRGWDFYPTITDCRPPDEAPNIFLLLPDR